MMFTIENLISDARLALQSKAYFSSLLLTFSIISACANAEYPDEWFTKNANSDKYLQTHFKKYFKTGTYQCPSHDKERFQMWVDDWENNHNCDNSLKSEMKDYILFCEENRQTPCGPLPRINGELLYQLRCALFHNGTSNIAFDNQNKISDQGNSAISPDMFILTLDSDNLEYSDLTVASSVNSLGKSSISINIGGLINHYLYLAELYCKKNPNKVFQTIRVQDNKNS